MIARAAASVHRRLAHAPRWIVRLYFQAISLISRSVFSRSMQRRVRNSLCGYGHSWPSLDFGPRTIRLGKDTTVRLIPHLGEFDEDALFTDRIDYEPYMFEWLESRVQDYDLIIEIGANVGIYSVFFDAVARRLPEGQRPRLVAFEPAHVAFQRLQRNLAANKAWSVTAYQAAVGEHSGLQSFYEPVGHLTNGSFMRSFAEHFSPRVNASVAVVVAASELEHWLKTAKRGLVKIDVEGFEPQLLTALRSLLETYGPDLIVEVMPSTAGPLNADPVLAAYDRYLITGEGLRSESSLYFSQQHFDWFLTRAYNH